MKNNSIKNMNTFPCTVIGVLILLSACGAQVTGIDSGGGQDLFNEGDPNRSRDEEVTAFTNKTGPEIMVSFQAVTGVSPNARTNNKTMTQVYSEVKSMLPMDQKIQLLGGGSANGIFILSEAFCSAMFDNLLVLRQHLPMQVNIAANTPANLVFNVAANRDFFTKSVLDKFWGLEVDNENGFQRGQDRASAELELNNLISLLTASSQTPPITAQNLAKGACVPALASSPVVMK
jgi:hypothetical protein